jgi:transposase
MNKTRSYTKEFRQQAVKVAEDLGSVMEAGRQLGIPSSNIYLWQRKYSGEVIVASRKPEAKPSELAEEINKLRHENSQLKKVNHILKAAAAFFSQDHLK